VEAVPGGLAGLARRQPPSSSDANGFDKLAAATTAASGAKPRAIARRLQQAVVTAKEAGRNSRRQIQEWKNILLRGQNPDDYNKHLAAFKNQEKVVQAQIAELQGLLQDLGLDATWRPNWGRPQRIGNKYREGAPKLQPDQRDVRQDRGPSGPGNRIVRLPPPSKRRRADQAAEDNVRELQAPSITSY